MQESSVVFLVVDEEAPILDEFLWTSSPSAHATVCLALSPS